MVKPIALSIIKIFKPFNDTADIERALKICYNKNIQTLANNLCENVQHLADDSQKIDAIYCAALEISDPLADSQSWFGRSYISDNLNYALDKFLATDALFILHATNAPKVHKNLEEFYTAMSGKSIHSEDEQSDENTDDENASKAKMGASETNAKKFGTAESKFRNFSKHTAKRLRSTPLNYLWDLQQNVYRAHGLKLTSKLTYKIPKFMDNYLYHLLCVKAAHPFAATNQEKLNFKSVKSFFEQFYSETNPLLPDDSLDTSAQVILSNYLTSQLFDLRTAAYISQLHDASSSFSELSSNTILKYLISIFFIPNPLARSCYCNLFFRLSFCGDTLITYLDNKSALNSDILASIKPVLDPVTTQNQNSQKLGQFLQHQIFSVYPLLRSAFFYFLCKVFPDEGQRESALVSFIQNNSTKCSMFIVDKYYSQKSEDVPLIENLINETSKAFPQLSDCSEASWSAFWKAIEPNSTSLVSIFKKLNAKLSNPEFIENLYQASQLNFIDSTNLYRECILNTVVTAKAKTDIGLFPHYDT